MIKKDFHGWKLEDAEHEVHLIIGDVRSNGASENAEFITGHGIIKKSIQDILKQYGLNSETQWGNSGVIVVTIE